jgi:hypothetical protein
MPTSSPFNDVDMGFRKIGEGDDDDDRERGIYGLGAGFTASGRNGEVGGVGFGSSVGRKPPVRSPSANSSSGRGGGRSTIASSSWERECVQRWVD